MYNSIRSFPLRLVTSCTLLTIFLGAARSAASHAQTESQPELWGDQGKDNRTNVCSKLIDRHWVKRSSTCTSDHAGNYTHTHATGPPDKCSLLALPARVSTIAV